MQTKKLIQQSPISKIQFFKNRFLQILDYIGGEKFIIAASEIRKLPDIALNGFQDIYLTAKIILITLNQFNKNDFSKLSNEPIKQNLIVALFDSDIEGIQDESIDETFAFCRTNCKENITDCLSIKFSFPPQIAFDFFSELESLKSACFTFIDFVDKNIESINKSANNRMDSLTIENTYQSPQKKGILEHAEFLTEPGLQKIIKNDEILVIDQMIPCFAVVLVAENNNKQIACLGKHVFPGEYQFSTEDHKVLYEDLHKLITSLKSIGYDNCLRMFITGGSMTSLSLILKLIMFKWDIGQDSPLFIQDIYLLPSYYNYYSHCIVNLFDEKCSFQVGGELYNNDYILCNESGLNTYSDEESFEAHELSNIEPNESDLPSDHFSDIDNDVWTNSIDERPLKKVRIDNLMNKEVPARNINFFNSPKSSPLLNNIQDSSKQGSPKK